MNGRTCVTRLRGKVPFLACLAMIAAGGGFAIPADAATLQIKCPANEVTVEVTSRLSHPWWSTPAGARLSDVEVINVGGDPALACFYRTGSGREVGVLRPFPPRYPRCEARRSQRDFVCTN